MSNEELEMLKQRGENRVELVRAFFGGVKDLLVIAASVATLWIQTQNAGKIDVAAQTAASTNAITTQWWAERTGKPQDEAKAAAAAERLESVMP